MDYTFKKEVMVKISNTNTSKNTLNENLSVSSTYNKGTRISKQKSSKELEIFT
jgi:hypothetical protein